MDQDFLGGCLGSCLSGLGVGSFDELAGFEARAGPDQGDQVRGVHGAPMGLCSLDELERHRQPGRAGARPAGDFGAVSDGGEGRFDGYLEFWKRSLL